MKPILKTGRIFNYMKSFLVPALLLSLAFSFIMVQAEENVTTEAVGECYTTPEGETICTETGILQECNITDEEQETLFRNLAFKRSSILDYNFTNITSIYCRQANDTRMVSGEIVLKGNNDSVKYETMHFSANMLPGDFVEVTYVSNPRSIYNFSAYFTEEENRKTDRYLREKIIDSDLYGAENELMWMQIFQYVMECDGVECITSGTTCNDFRIRFNALLDDILYDDYFFFSKGDYCQGIIKTWLSQARNLVRNWTSYVSYFGKELRFSFYGNSTIKADLDGVVDVLGVKGFEVCFSDRECNWESDKLAYYSRKTINFYLSDRTDKAWFYAGFSGPVGGTGTVYASISGEKTDLFYQSAKASIENALASLGIYVNVTFRENERKPETLYDSGFKYYYFEQEVGIPDADYDEILEGWDRDRNRFHTLYRKGNMGVMISEPYVSFWERSNGELINWMEISENKVFTSVITDSLNFLEAEEKFNEKVKTFVNASGEWEVDYYPVGDNTFLYGGDALESRFMEGTGAPSFGARDDFQKTFNEMKAELDAMETGPPGDIYQLIIIFLSAFAGLFLFLMVR
jgi:hypothetical protein